MEFTQDGRTVELSTGEILEVIDDFLSLVVMDEEICDVLVFGGTISEPERVHGDIDVLLCVDDLPSEETLLSIASKWKEAIKDRPMLGLIDCFLTDADKVVWFGPNLDYAKEFQITEEPPSKGEGSLDDDSTHLYIGPTKTLDDFQ